MKKSLLEIYALAVCFVTLICFVVALGIGIYDLIQVANPEFTVNPDEYERHQLNEGFQRNPTLRGLSPAVPLEAPQISDEGISEQREQSYQSALRSERRRGLQSLTIVGIVMLIDLCVFSIHWILGRRARVIT
jgi:hypothetical protein